MKTVFILVLLLSIGSVTFAKGTESSGGGPSVYCDRSAPNAWTGSYDLFEGRYRYGLETYNHPAGVDQAVLIEEAFRKLELVDYGVAAEARIAYSEILKHTAYLPPNILLGSPTDLGNSQPPLIPIGCQLMYVGFYEPTGTFRISKSIYDKFNFPMDRAALFVHEALYKIARAHTQQTDSESTRLVTAFLFSDLAQPTDDVLEALSTMVIGGKLSPLVRVNPSEGSVTFRTSCAEASETADVVYFYLEAQSVDSRGALVGQRTKIGGVTADVGTSTTRTFAFDPTAKAIAVFRSDISQGRCLGKPLEIVYAGIVIGRIEAAGHQVGVTPDFYIRLSQ